MTKVRDGRLAIGQADRASDGRFLPFTVAARTGPEERQGVVGITLDEVLAEDERKYEKFLSDLSHQCPRSPLQTYRDIISDGQRPQLRNWLFAELARMQASLVLRMQKSFASRNLGTGPGKTHIEARAESIYQERREQAAAYLERQIDEHNRLLQAEQQDRGHAAPGAGSQLPSGGTTKSNGHSDTISDRQKKSRRPIGAAAGACAEHVRKMMQKDDTATLAAGIRDFIESRDGKFSGKPLSEPNLYRTLTDYPELWKRKGESDKSRTTTASE